jgi:hypothetical protein
LIELPDSGTAFGATVAMPPFTLGATASGGMVDSTYTLLEEDFPFHQLTDILNRNSVLNITTNDVVSSAGAVDATFSRIRLSARSTAATRSRATCSTRAPSPPAKSSRATPRR